MYMRAIIFDMDGTLLDSEGYWTRAPLVLLERKGIHVDPNNRPATQRRERNCCMEIGRPVLRWEWKF